MSVRPSVRRASLIAPVLAAGLLAPFASADDVTPVTPATQVFLQCDGSSPEYFTGESTGGSQPNWGPAKPASVTTGSGCGKLDDGVLSGAAFQTPYQFGFNGSYTGNVDALTVSLYSVHAAQGRDSLKPVDLEVRMTVDGVSMFGNDSKLGATGTAFSIPAGRVITVKPVATGTTGAVTKYTFTIDKLALLGKDDNIEHAFAFDVAVGDLGHETWLWGADEAPAGALINPATVTGVVAHARDRADREATG